MKKFFKRILKNIVLPLLIVLFILFCGFVIYRNAIIKESKITNAIKTPDGIESLEEVRIEDKDFWLYIRSQNKKNPILLFIHGGPAISSMPFAKKKYQGKLEENFNVIHWDQRGCGKSYNSSIDAKELTLDHYISDTIKLSEYLLKRFNQKKIYLVGHSWGSVIGLLSAHRKPHLFHAYIGLCQIVNMEESEKISYNYTLVKSKENNDQYFLEKLLGIGSPPFRNLYIDTLIQKLLVIYYGGGLYNNENYIYLYAKEFLDFYGYDLIDLLYSLPMGVNITSSAILPELTRVNFHNLKKIEIPVYFCLGLEDYVVPGTTANNYLENLNAPIKELFWFNKSGHFPHIEEPEKFYGIMNEILSDTFEKE